MSESEASGERLGVCDLDCDLVAKMETLYYSALGMSQALDAANKCRLLPPKPQHAKLLHTASRLHLASDEVQFLLDAESDMSIVAVKGAALSHNCRNLVSELGGARIIRHGGPDQLTPFASLRLRAAYGADTPIEEVEPDAQAIDNLRAAADGDRCEVVFARRGKRQRAAEYAAAALRRASRVALSRGARQNGIRAPAVKRTNGGASGRETR